MYWAIQELVKKGIDKIDSLSLITQLSSRNGTIKVMGGNNDAIEKEIQGFICDKKEFGRSTVEEYKLLANQVLANGFKRAMYEVMGKIQNKCLDVSNDDIGSLNIEIMDTINNLAIDYITQENIDYFGRKVDTLWQNIESKRNPDGTFGILPKWKILSNYFTYQPGELVAYKARRKQGKSVIAMNEAIDKAKSGLNVVYFDTEMRDELFFTRLLSHMTQIPENRIKSGNYSHEERKILDETMKYIKSLPLIHEYDPRWNRNNLVTQAKILHNKGKLDFFIFDYVKDTSGKNTSSVEQYNELGYLCDAIKNDICGSLNVPGITFAQLNRDGNTADSDKIDRYVTASVTWRQKTPDEIIKYGKEYGNYCMRVDFNRIGDSHEGLGEDEYIDFLFNGEVLTIEECANQHIVEETPFD